MAAKTRKSKAWQPMLGADPARLRRFGELLRQRRAGAPPAGLGYRYMPAFEDERDINVRMITDVERGRRDTYTLPSLQDVADAYGVTYDSMMAVVWSGADELTPVPAPAPAAPPPDEDTPPMTPERAAAGQSWYDEINERRVALAAQGITNPTGEQMFGAGTDDARAWDEHGYWSVKDRVHFIAELRRWAAGRVPNSDTGVTGA